jgi:hypothetical protein
MPRCDSDYAQCPEQQDRDGSEFRLEAAWVRDGARDCINAELQTTAGMQQLSGVSNSPDRAVPVFAD